MIVYHELTLFDVSPRGGVRARANLGRVDGRDRGDVVVSSGRGEPPLRFPRVDTYARASVMNGRLPVAPPTREALGADDVAVPELHVESFILANVSPRDDDLSGALSGPTPKTVALWAKCKELLAAEFRAGGCLGVDASRACTITSHAPAWIDPELDDVVPGLQTESPLVRGIKPLGGVRLLSKALAEHANLEVPPDILHAYGEGGARRTHNDCVFDLYTPEMRAARKNHIITGLPDTYGRGRHLGDYRRVALYGVDALASRKRAERLALARRHSADESRLRLREELSLQIRALEDLARMAAGYDCDVTRPAASASEATRWTYLAYLAAVKSNDGAAISLGRLDAFLDVYIERDLRSGALRSEAEAQELIDHLVIKLRLVRQLRPRAYDEIFAGDPVWATCCLGGCPFRGGAEDGARKTFPAHLVTSTSWRFLQSLVNLGPAPEPNMTVLWDDALPSSFRAFAASVSVGTSSIQYENDALMRRAFRSGDYGVSCCVSGLRLGKDAQYFGARCNLPKLLLYALNGGVDEITGARVAPESLDASLGGSLGGDAVALAREGFVLLEHAERKTVRLPPLRYDDVRRRFDAYVEWLTSLYADVMNAVHYSHDAHYYEAAIHALVDTNPRRFAAFGVAGLSVLVDSLSAIKHAAVVPVCDATTGLTVGFDVEGEWPAFGVDDDAVDAIAVDVIRAFRDALARRAPTYRDATPTLSVLTITSNVMYGTHTGATPDGRPAGAPFAPGANPMHGRDDKGALASLNSVAKIPYDACLDGVSNTFSIPASSLGKTEESRVTNLCALLSGYFARGGQHLNVNVVSRAALVDAMRDPTKHPNLTVRVSGYAVNFNRLSLEHKREIIARTFHESV